MPKPTQEQLNTIAHSLARRLAYTPADIDDLVQEALWGLHQAYHYQHRKPRKDFAFARTVMHRAIITYYNKRRLQPPLEPLLPGTPIPLPPRCTEGDRIDNEIVLHQYFDALECGCGRTARLIAENLIAPSDPVICEYIIKEVAQKQRLAKNKRHRTQVRAFKHIRLSQRQIREALGFTRSQFTTTLQEVRKFTRGWLAISGRH